MHLVNSRFWKCLNSSFSLIHIKCAYAYFYPYSAILSATDAKSVNFTSVPDSSSPDSIPFRFLDSVFIVLRPSCAHCESGERGSRRIPRESMQSISINDRKNSTGCIPFLDRLEWFSRSRSLKLTYGFLTVATYPCPFEAISVLNVNLQIQRRTAWTGR